MKKTLSFKLLLIIALFTLTIAGCKKNEKPAEPLPVNAVVINAGAVAADGCGWLIKIDDDTRYSPTNLDDKYKENNLNVVITYQVLDSKFSCGWGAKVTEIRIISIRKK